MCFKCCFVRFACKITNIITEKAVHRLFVCWATLSFCPAFVRITFRVLVIANRSFQNEKDFIFPFVIKCLRKLFLFLILVFAEILC